ncbi:hypothetical protein [Actinokineospora sp.]|uniref:hypothetical protein n=1 Tax=Actinokineospora sp. TaxID=1872133 RepID=UPI00403763BD
MTADPLRTAHELYRRFGWPTVLGEHAVTLPLGIGICALDMDELIGPRVAAALRTAHCLGPVCVVPAEPTRWIFLAEADGTVPGRAAWTARVRFLPSSSAVPLPPTNTPGGAVRWVCGPRPNRRWLPTCTAILTSAPLRNRRTG